MALFIVSYDLHKVRDYGALHKLLDKWKAKKLLESLWLVELNSGAEPVLDAVQATLDRDDSIAVVELKAPADWCTYLAEDEGSAWLERKLSVV